MLSRKEIVFVMIEAMGVTAAIAILFYENICACILYPVIFAIVWRRTKRELLEKRKQMISIQFLDAMRAVGASLLSGYSMENAWKEAQKEIKLLHGSKSYLYVELEEINRSVELSIPIESLLEQFGVRTGIEEIQSFAEVFSFSKRSGGDFVKMIETTTNHMRLKQETQQEISVAIASRRLEQKVMNLVPLFILAYLRVSSGDYLDALYHNAFGVVFMTACLGLYALAIVISERLTAIRI